MRLVATRIPEGSHGIRVWVSLGPGDDLPEKKVPYDFACNLIHVDSETCELAQAIGVFNTKVAFAIGRKAKELGYIKMIYYEELFFRAIVDNEVY